MKSKFLVLSDVTIAGVSFHLQYQYGEEESVLAFFWNRADMQNMELSALSSSMKGTPLSFAVPEQLAELKLSLSAIQIQYDFKRHIFTFYLEAEHYGSFTVSYRKKEFQSIWTFLLQMQAKFLLNSLPVFGSGFSREDYVALKEFSLQLESGSGDKEKMAVHPGLELLWKLGSTEVLLSLPDGRQNTGLRFAEDEQTLPHYLDINRDFGAFRLSRIGFAMGESEVTLYVDAGIRLSILLLEFIGLYLSISFSVDKKVEYGLQGAAISVSKPPIYISGGLVLTQSNGMKLFTGEVAVQFKGIGVTALCSYGEFAQGDSSLFAFLLVSANLGGPPIFYVTGLAGGFGYNRSIVLPDKVQEVERFPFVAAAMGKGELKKGMTPAEVLTKMEQVIIPAKDCYFFSVGVRFQSFGLLDSFLLCNVEFGECFVVSLLGVSSLSLPLSAKNPLVAIKLAIKAVLVLEEGVFSVEGALIDGSYILDKNCKVNGGFACCIWFGESEHAGDFVVTLGGYRNGYNVAHYPKVDRLSVNWKMDSHLVLSAEAYFALTPACVMMGGNLEIVYESGRLKAWFKAWAEFFMQWEPFLYDVGIGIRIGASYRWDFFPFYKTFKVELGADLEFWGPPFGGKVHVSWFIISFTISFGEDRPQEKYLEWQGFAEKFLSENDKRTTEGDVEGIGAIRIQPVAGLVRSGEKTGVYLLNADTMEIEITSQVMSSKLYYGLNKLAEYQGHLGVVPMGIPSLDSRLTVELMDAKGQPVTNLRAEPIYTNAPKALWNCSKPQKEETDSLLTKVPFGVKLVSTGSSPQGVLPKEGSYDIEVLCANEKLGPHWFTYETPAPISSHIYPAVQVLKQVEESIGVMGGRRKLLLEELSGIFGVRTEEELLLGGMESGLERMLRAEPVLAAIGENV